MATLFWVGGSGNWSDATNHWSTLSGGPPGVGNLPTAADDVVFDALSNTTAYTLTIDATNKVCKNLNFSAAPSVSGTITWAGSVQITVSGNMTLLNGMTRTYTGALIFNATSGTQNITCNTVTLASTCTFSGSGGTWQMQDNFNISSAKNIVHSAGTLDFNGKTITYQNYTGSGTGTLTMGAATITSSGDWVFGASQTLTANTANMTFSKNGVTFTGAGKTYNNVTINGATSITTQITGANTFANLTITGTSSKNTGVDVGADQTITTFVINGQSLINRIFMRSVDSAGTITPGTTRTLTVTNAPTITNSDFQDITIAGAGAPASGTSIGDAGNNSGFTFTTPVTRYKISGNNTYSSTSAWSTGSGGGSGASVPLCHDTVVIDGSSFGAGATFTIDMKCLAALDFSNATNTPAITFNATGAAHQMLGSLNLTSTGTLTQTTAVIFFAARSAFSLTSAGKTFTKALEIVCAGATLTLNDAAISTGSGDLILFAGGLDLNNQTLTCASFDFNSTLTRSLAFGSGTIKITGSTSPWLSNATAFTLTPGTGTIKFTDSSNTAITFAGVGQTWNNIWWNRGASTGALTLTGTNTFNDWLDDGTGAHTYTMPNVTTTISTFRVRGASGALVTLQRTGASGTWTLSCAKGPIICDWLSISNSTASGGAVFFAGANTTNGGSNSGWKFYGPAGSVGGGSATMGSNVGSY